MPAVTLAELKKALRASPITTEDGIPGQIGVLGDVGFICLDCIARLNQTVSIPRTVAELLIWQGDAEALKDHDCVLCGAHWHGGK